MYSDPDDDGGDSGDNPGGPGYFDLLDELSKKWLAIQLTHNVSLKATDAFWKVIN